MNTARIHARILARSKSVNIVETHMDTNCPAFGKTWTKCNEKNHLAKNSLYIQSWQSENQKWNPEKSNQEFKWMNENSASDEPDSDESIYSLQSSRKQEAVYCIASRVSKQNRNQHSNQISTWYRSLMQHHHSKGLQENHWWNATTV